jgi:hypothetical protein
MKDAIEVSMVFHEGNRMMAVPKQPAPVQEPVAALIDENQRLRAELKFNTLPAQPAVHDLLNALETLTNMAESFPDELHKDHPDVIAARAAIAKATGEKP